MGIFSISYPNITVAIGMPQPPRYAWTEAGMSARCTIRVAATDENLLYNELTGQALGDGTVQIPVQLRDILQAANRTVPDQLPKMYVTDITTRPFRSDEGSGYVNMVVRCETFPYRLEGADALLREEMELSGEFVHLPNEGNLWWEIVDTGPPVVGTPVGESVSTGHMVALQDWVLIRHRVTLQQLTAAHQAGMRNWPNSVNVVDHYSPKFSTIEEISEGGGYRYEFPKHTLMYRGHRITRDTDTAGADLYRLHIILRYRDSKWNRWFRPGFTAPQIIKKADNTDFMPYPEKDWSAVIPKVP